ncbi:MAG: RNA polymerase subunit sigma-70 [Acidobacteria bacterium]|nr:RNA polymerase subunit sigma-70 [Acidobacteriota bacterium]
MLHSLQQPTRISAGENLPITQRLRAWSQGDADAAREVLPWIYDDLRLIASSYIRRERPDFTLQSTALVHEAYLKIFGTEPVRWQNRFHFLAIAARVMRQLLVDYSRGFRAAKRGGGSKPLPLLEALDSTLERAPELTALDQALRDLASLDREAAAVVELRFFGGLNASEIAAALDLAPAGVERLWRRARGWLYAELAVGAS